MTYYAKADVGLDHYTCACGDHCFAYPFDDAMESWRKFRVTNSTVRRLLEEKGMVVDTPPPPQEPHVILLSPDDAYLFKLKRWRIFPSPARKRAKYEVKRAVMSKALQRLIHPDAEVIQLRDNNGADLRRSNLVVTNMRDVCRQREKSKRLRARAS